MALIPGFFGTDEKCVGAPFDVRRAAPHGAEGLRGEGLDRRDNFWCRFWCRGRWCEAGERKVKLREGFTP